MVLCNKSSRACEAYTLFGIICRVIGAFKALFLRCIPEIRAWTGDTSIVVIEMGPFRWANTSEIFKVKHVGVGAASLVLGGEVA